MNKNNKKILIICIIFIILLTSITLYLLINKNAKQIKEIYVASLPEKTIYFQGEQFDIQGLKVCALQNNGISIFIDITQIEIKGFDSTNVKEKQTITVVYLDYTCTFNISITEPPKLVPTLTSIELISLPKTIYKKGEKLDTENGILKLNYSDGQTMLVMLINNYVYGFTNEVANTPGVYTLIVRYTENGVLQETSYTITVEE